MKKALNILLGVVMAISIALLVYAVATGGSEAAVSVNIIWTYFLMVFALLSIVFASIFGMAQHPASVKSTMISTGVVIVIIGAAYFLARGHEFQIINIADGGFFDQSETVIADTSILVTYVAMLGAFAATIYSEVAGLFK